MKTISTSAALATLILLAACNPRSAPSANQTGLQEDYRTEAMATTRLTADEKAKLAAFSALQQAKDPSTDLYFGKMTDSANQLARLNPTVKADVQKIKDNCKIDAGAPDSDQGEGQLNKPTATSKTRSISGANCAVSFLENSKTTSTVTAVDSAASIFTGSGSTDLKSVFTVTDLEMAKDLMFVSETTTSHYEYTMVNVKSDAHGQTTSGQVHSKAVSNNSYVARDGSALKLNLKVEQSTDGEKQNEQMLMSASIPGVPKILIARFKIGDKNEILLNGEPYSADQLKKDFAIDFTSSN